MTEVSDGIRVAEDVVVLAIIPAEPGYRCPQCQQVWPARKFENHPKTWCVYCAAEENSERMDKVLSRRAEELTQRLLSKKGSRNLMETVEDFFGEYDACVGGIRMYAKKMDQVVEGLLQKGAFTAAGQILLQLLKLRFLVHKQNSKEDFEVLNLEQKRDMLKLEIVKLLSERGVEEADPATKLLLESLDAHGVVGDRVESEKPTLIQ